MENLKRSIRYQLIDSKKFLLGFFSVMILVDIVFIILNNIFPDNVVIGFSLGNSEATNATSIAAVNLMAILIALLVYNYTSNYERFPLAISLSMTRKNYFLSFLTGNIFVAFISASIQGVLMKIDPYLIKLADRTPIYDFGYFNTQTDNVFYIIFILFIVFLSFICFWNLVSSINYKIGYKMWLILIGINILISVLRIELFGNIFNAIGNVFVGRFGAYQILIILLAMTIAYGLNYLVVKRTDIKKRLG